ncbi:endonuclease/exonuclease/phosphatase family protein [Kribbia dieselivorans]|uniref:endonuclease/exonuclease/phosphatase family protein n=1 Tax=Kribbia dieselivorans TaxID=331526 RepID=UPI000837F655|nr:endonuclease/exonuclease/phosphatase family protein [Kribbia dieselivorans]
MRGSPPSRGIDDPPPVSLRVATYNIRYGAGMDGAFDLDRIASAIDELDADIVGLQEVDVHWGSRSNHLDVAQEIADRTGMHVVFAPIYDLPSTTPGAPNRQFGVAVLSRYPIVDFINHDLTRLSTQDANPTPAPAPGFAEAVIEAKGARLHVYSTHLDYRADPTVRRLQVSDTLAVLAERRPGATQILLGDLNAPATAPEIAPLWNALTSVTTVNTQPTFPAGRPTSRIDHIGVTSNVTITGAAVPSTDLAASASDHRPLVADLLVPRGQSSNH